LISGLSALLFFLPDFNNTIADNIIIKIIKHIIPIPASGIIITPKIVKSLGQIFQT